MRSGSPFPAKGFQLLALLCRSPSRRLARKEAATLLWDSSSEAESLTNLRQLLTRVRRSEVLKDNLFTADSVTVALEAKAARVDLLAFETLASGASAPDMLRGLALFRGDLLAGVDDVTEEYSDWLIRERAALRERFFAVAASAVIELTRYGRAPKSDLRAIAEQVLGLEPEREASYRMLIEAHGRNGQVEEARHLFLKLKEMLEREFRAAPAPETAAVARRVFAVPSDRPPLGLEPGRASKLQPRVAFLGPTLIGDGTRPAILSALIEDVANELVRYRTFAVLAPHSSFKVGHDSGIPLDNGRLRADYTVSGFAKPGFRGDALALRMTNCTTKEIVWAGEFSLDLADLSQTFRMLSLRVASTLAAKIERDAFRDLHKASGDGAYLHYLEGQTQLNNSDLVGLRRARKSFREALAIDPGFAAARARIAQTLCLEWLNLGGGDPQLLVDAREQAGLAVDLDPGSALGHWMTAVVALYQRDYALSRDKFAEAETLHPHSADLLLQHGDALGHLGRAADGWKRFELALDLNPMPPDHYWWAGASISFGLRDFEQSIALCKRLTSDEPVLRILTACHALVGDGAMARAYGRRLMEIYPGESAAEIIKLAPDHDKESVDLFLEALRMAGVP